MAEQSIPAAMLDAAVKAIALWLENDDRPKESNGVLLSIAQAAFKAAGVPALLAENAALKQESQREAQARVAELTKKYQENQFHPDWSVLEATRESLREAWAKLKEMERTAADASNTERDVSRH